MLALYLVLAYFNKPVLQSSNELETFILLRCHDHACSKCSRLSVQTRQWTAFGCMHAQERVPANIAT